MRPKRGNVSRPDGLVIDHGDCPHSGGGEQSGDCGADPAGASNFYAGGAAASEGGKTQAADRRYQGQGCQVACEAVPVSW